MAPKATANRTLAVPALLAVSCLWGSSFVAIKIAAEGFAPLEIAALRVSVAALCLLAIWLPLRERLPRDRAILGRIILLAIVGQIVPFVSLGASGHLTDSGSMAVMMGFAPVATLAIGRFVLPDERWTWGRWSALAIGFAGVIVALEFGQPGGKTAGGGEAAADLLGRLLAGLAALGYAVGAVISRSITRELSPLGTCALTMTLSAVLLGTYGGVVGMSIGAADGPSWGAIVMLGVVNTALAYAIYFRLIADAGATFASLNNYLVPIVGVAAGSLLLGEHISGGAAVGLAMVLGSIFMVSRGGPREGLLSSRGPAYPRPPPSR